MTPWKLPPVEKIYEALSVLSDKRYEIKSNESATITSSAGDKKYSLKWKFTDDGSIVISSNDNASRWQGYTGYPIIAILMITGKITFSEDLLPWFRNIAWNDLNKKFRNDYSAVVNMLLSGLKDPETENKIRDQVYGIFEQLKNLKLYKPGSN